MRSMTGFGQSSMATDIAEIEVQVKTVNSRYLDLKIRLPRELLGMEQDLRKEIQSHLHRGRVDLWVEVRSRETGLARVNPAQVRAYLRAAQELADLGVQGNLELGTLLALPDVFDSRGNGDRQLEGVASGVKQCLGEALEQVVRHRQAEGQTLKEDVQDRLIALAGVTDQIEEQAESVAEFQRQRLQEVLASLDDLPEVDATRLVQEVAFYTERVDISEEITRLRSHLIRFEELLEADQSVIGKNLDFLCQELNREMNTVLSKAGRVEISEVAVAGKTEIERIREQVQNVE